MASISYKKIIIKSYHSHSRTSNRCLGLLFWPFLTANASVVSDRLTERSIRYSGHLQGICFASGHRHAEVLWIPVDEIPFPWPRRTRLEVTYHKARNDFTMINACSFFVIFPSMYLSIYFFSSFPFFPLITNVGSCQSSLICFPGRFFGTPCCPKTNDGRHPC